MVSAVQEMAHWVPEVPIILESQVPPDGIEPELRAAARAFEEGAGHGVATGQGLAASVLAPHAI